MEDPKSPSDRDERPKSSSPSIQREEEQDMALEPAEELECSIDEPPTKRRPAWFKETLQEAEKHATPSGTFRESRRPQKFKGYVALVSSVM